MAEWQAFYAIDPFGESRADLRLGIMASLYAASKTGKEYKPADFMPFAESTTGKLETPEQQIAYLQAMTLFAGGNMNVR